VLCLLDGIGRENSDTVRLWQYLLLSFAISRARYCLCCGILHPLDHLLVVQTVFEHLDGLVTKQDPLWHLESVDCIDPILGIHSTTTREGSKSANRLETE
jgi:hypothetical protein